MSAPNIIQWSLRIKDTLGLAMLSFCREVVLFLKVQNVLVLWEWYFKECLLQRGHPFLEGPLSEVPLYSSVHYQKEF